MRGFHDGQRAAQRRAGDTTLAERLERGIHPALGDVEQEFLAGLTLLFVAVTDPAGHVWASVLSGPPGFIDTPDDRTLTAAAQPPADSPLEQALGAGPVAVGLLAIEPQTRRRIRVNGTGTLGLRGLVVRTEQVYSNCPKYIQRRHVTATAGAAPVTVERDALSDADRRMVAAADTFVIATAGPDGADASHRGGEPGFVTVRDERHLRFPDYPGNTMYMTLGNLEANPRAGLLFLDWETGAALQLSGRAAIDWSAERGVDFAIERVIATTGAIPYRWALDERSRFNPPVAGNVPGSGGPR